jgi:signal transduction histidine kinase
VVLSTAVIGSAMGVLAEFGPWAARSPGGEYRITALGAIAVTGGYQLLRRRRVEPVLAVGALAFCVLSLTETGRMSGFDSGNTMAVLILISLLYVGTRESGSIVPLLVGAGVISVYAVVSTIVESPPTSEAVVRLMIGIPGQALVMWVTWRLIGSLAEASERQAKSARIQEALATCSRALLIGRDDEPLSAALKALLDATEADYAYVDVNRVDNEGNATWEIVAEAVGVNVPSAPNIFYEGDYSQFPDIVDTLSSGAPARIRVADLPLPVRSLYEAEGVRSELMAPVMIRDQWVGTLGYSDFWRDDAWTEVEVDGLMRAAEMVGAFWEREWAREGLEELAEAKNRFIATVSHELRTPLSAVVGFSAELAQGLDRYSLDEIAEMVALISTQSIEVAQLVDDLLTAERAASGNLTFRPSAIDLLEESRSIVESLQVDLEVSVEGGSAPAWADTLRTRQIVRNLLTNAHRYGGGQVRIEVGSSGSEAMLTVSDDGPGVRGIDADHIFDPYYRSQSTSEVKPDSVGLGLAVARQLARMMGGDLVYTRRDGWTRFELTLPALAEPVPATTS